MLKQKTGGARFVLAAAVLTFAVLAALMALMCEASHAASNFTIEDYDIDMVVNEDDTYDIHEKLLVHFTAPSHGIYRTIPYRTRLDRDGQVSSFYAKVRDFRMLSGQKVKLERRNGEAFYRIGDKNKYADENTEYEYTYTYDTCGDHLQGADEVYHNLVGTSWETPEIKHVSFRVTFPKDIDMNNVGMKTGFQQDVEFETDGKRVVKGETTLSTVKGLTIRAVLPEGYFTRQAKPANILLFILAGILAAAAVIGLALWRRFGVDPDIIEPVEFYPPKGLTPAEVGYLCDGTIKGDHVISMLLSLADKGYLKITETQTKSRFLKRDITEYTITKLKECDGGLIGEKTFMNGLFKKGDVVNVKDLTNSFYKTVQDIQGKITKKYDKKLKDQKAAGVSGGMCLAGFLGMLATVIVSKIANNSPFLEYGFLTIIFIAIAALLPCLGFYIMGSRINSVKHGVGGVFIIILGLLTALFGLGSAALFNIFTAEQFIPYVICMAMVFLIYIAAALCERKSDFYADILGKIRGYRNFLKHAEKDRMEALAEEDPDFFYRTLAFAFALGVTSVFAKKFASLATKPPEWYETSYIYTGNSFDSLSMMNSLDSMMKSTGSSMTSSPSSSGSGGGSFSGGGGGGGGGGGSW